MQHHYQRRAMLDALEQWLRRLNQQLYSAGEDTGAFAENVPAQLDLMQALAAIDTYAQRQIRDMRTASMVRSKRNLSTRVVAWRAD